MALNPKHCPPGKEKYDFFSAMGRKRVQYDYRHKDGELFSCIANSLEAARARKQDWLNVKIARDAKAILKGGYV